MHVQQFKKILIVVADASMAKFYIAHGPKRLTTLLEVSHAASRLKDHDLTTKEHDVNTCPYETTHTKKTHEKQCFAKEIVSLIEKFLASESAEEVCIFAPSKFLGEINLTRHHHLQSIIKVTEVAKDLIHAAPEHVHKMVLSAGLSFMAV